MDLSKLQTLKEMLVKATKFNEVLVYFFDEFVDKPGFMSLGQPVSSVVLKQTLAEIGAQLMGTEATLSRPMLVHLPNHKFIHGSFMLGKWMGTVLYFEDIERGLVTLSDLSGMTYYGRFSLIKTQAGKTYTLN